MLNIFLSVVPIFLLIVAGYTLKKTVVKENDFWAAADKLVYYLFFPALLLLELTKADFSGGGVSKGVIATVGATLSVAVLLLVIQQVRPMKGDLFTSVFQGGVRYNSYVFIALSQSLFGREGVALSGIFIAYMIVIGNVSSVLVLNQYGNSSNKRNVQGMLLALLKNPLIVSVVIGIILNVLNIQITGAIKQFMLYLGNAATPLSLMSVGAGLLLAMSGHKALATSYALVLKLALLPLLGFALLYWQGVSGVVAGVALLYCAMPCAGNAYILSRQMGGDSEAMASIITWSTLLSVISVPLILGLFQI